MSTTLRIESFKPENIRERTELLENGRGRSRGEEWRPEYGRVGGRTGSTRRGGAGPAHVDRCGHPWTAEVATVGKWRGADESAGGLNSRPPGKVWPARTVAVGRVAEVGRDGAALRRSHEPMMIGTHGAHGKHGTTIADGAGRP